MLMLKRLVELMPEKSSWPVTSMKSQPTPGPLVVLKIS
jgi:hypothetical protein